MTNTTLSMIRNRSDRLAVSAGCYFDESYALRVKHFFQKYLRHSKGQFAGKPFLLEGWQWDDIILPLFGWRRGDGTRRFRRAYIEIPKKNGKPLAVDTLLPTPTGLVTMGETKVGDVVYDERGVPCNVVAVSEVFTDKECYEITFSDRTTVTAAFDHNWIVKDRHNRILRCVNTEHMFLRQRSSDNGNRWTVLVNGQCQSNDVALPLEPYLFGYYLGNGHTQNGGLACSTQDVDNVRSRISQSTRISPNGPNCVNIIVEGLYFALKQFGYTSFTDKFIPDNYLSAGTSQRLSLLQGLMDSDGCAGPKGQCIFVTGLHRLKEDMLLLLRSLGYKPTANYVDDTYRTDRNCSGHWRIVFSASKTNSPFGLVRKTEKLPTKLATRSSYKAVVSIVPKGVLPTKCIQVDSPSQMYLCSEGYTPTHNSTLCAGLTLYLMCGDGEPGAEVYSAAGDRAQASIVFNEAVHMVGASPALTSRIEIRDSKKEMYFPKNGSSYKALSAEVKTKEGLNIHGLIFDELHTQPNRKLWDALRYGGVSRRQSLSITITTAGDDITSLGYDEHCWAVKILAEDGDTRDDEYFAYIRAAGEKDDISSVETWKKANPGLGRTVPVADMRAAYEEAVQRPAMMFNFKRYRLNLWTFGTSGWILPEVWAKCDNLHIAPPHKGQKCYMGIDLSSVIDLTAKALFFPDTKELKLTYWAPQQQVEERKHNKKMRYDYWVEKNQVFLSPGASIDYNLIAKAVDADFDDYDVLQVGIDPWNATKFALELQAKGYRVNYVRQGFASMSPPMKELERLVATQELCHRGDPVLAWMIGNTRVETDVNKNVKPDKKNSRDSIDGTVAAIIALHLHLKYTKSIYGRRGMLAV